MESRDFEVKKFSEIKANSAMKVYIKKAPQQKVVVSSNAINYIVVSSENGILKVEYNNQNNSINNINAEAWKAAGVPYVVLGDSKTNADGSLAVHYQLYDVEKQKFLLNELLTVPASRVRSAAHMISDNIYEALTGIHGDFTGRIAYVLRNQATPAERYTLQIADTDGAPGRN